MTGFAADRGMLTNQREYTDVMVKANLVLPGNFIVTLAALGSLFFLVDIIRFVTAVAGGVDFPGFSAGEVASRTQQLLMPALEREVGFSVMIKGRDIPSFGGVTILALLAIRSMVYVVITMTAITVTWISAFFRNLVIDRMTVITGLLVVLTVELIFGIPVMIENRLIPAFLLVTIFTGIAKPVGMSVSDRMAVNTLLGGVFVFRLQVA